MASLLKLKELQGEDGAWSWFGGMSGNRYVTGYITDCLSVFLYLRIRHCRKKQR